MSRPALFAAALLALGPLLPAQETPPPTETEAATPHHPDEYSRLLQEWAPPGEEPPASGSGDARGFLGHYLSEKPFPEVWTHYAAKLAVSASVKFQPNYFQQYFPRLGPLPADGRATVTVKNVQFPGETESTATLTRREPSGRTVTIFLASRANRTVIFVTVVPAK